MTRLSILLAVLLAMGSSLIAAQQSTASIEKLFASAEHKATVDGDLKGAIDEYRRIVDRSGANRALAARALVRMAEAYQKLGDTEAQRIYARIVRDYADQKDAAAEARVRLASLLPAPARTAGIVSQQVWTGPKVDILGSVSPDGRYLSFTGILNSPSSGDLFLHDFATGADRVLTNRGTGEYAEESVISRDGKQVAYSWNNGKSHYELRTLRLETGALAPPRRLYDNEDVGWIGPYD